MFIQKAGILIVSALLVSMPFSAVITAKEITSNNGVTFQKNPGTNKLRMLRGSNGAIAVQKSAGESTADSVKRQFAPHFGIKNPTTELRVTKEHSPSANRQHIRYQQQFKGIPIIGAELVANLNNQQLTSMSGETSTVNVNSLTPEVNAGQAQSTAIAAVSKWHEIAPADLRASDPQLSIYDPALIGPGTGQQRLVWQLTITPTTLTPVNEYVLVDAKRNAIVLHFNQVDHVLDLSTHDAGTAQVLPGPFVCDETDLTCAAGGIDAQNAHLYVADSYNYFFNNHGRDSLDDNGMTIVTTVNYGSTANAFWIGEPENQMGFGPGYALADDVVAHEFTHGVTDNTSNLFYYYQSGAINESLSDVWGEFIDLTNARGTDGAPERWLMGEDLPGSPVRSMTNPPAYNDPDRMTSGLYATDAVDSGGVHTNSGVNNKAVVLMVDGGNFNGQTVTALGINKTAAIYYEVQTNYLVSGSDYLDLYNGLNQSCQNLIGTNGITSSDCTQVNNALIAVEMNQQPVANFNPKAIICLGVLPVNDIFFDDMENTSSGNWGTMTMAGTNNPWTYISDYTTSGSLSFGALPGGLVEDVALVNVTPVTLPAAGNVYLHFDHAFDYETNPAGPFYFDGGMLEYSINNGTTWIDAGALIDSGRTYVAPLSAGTTNPQAGRNAFVGPSHGYNSTRLNLSSLTGNNVQIRFRHTADSSVASFFWLIDNVRIYTCGAPPVANAGPDQTVNANTPNITLDGSGSSDPDSSFTYQWNQIAGTGVTLSGATTANPNFTSTPANAVLVFQLTTTDPDGNSDTDTVTITVNGPPTANAGGNQTVNLDASVTLNGVGSSDPEGSALTYSWMQTGGTGVTLSDATAVSPSFTAPSADSILTFQLTVTDDRNQTDTDSVTITVQTPPPPGGGGGGGCSVSENGRFDPVWLLLLMFFAGIHIRNWKRAKTKY